MCHALKTVTEGRDAGDLGGPSDRQLEDLGRWDNRTKSSLLTVTSDFRIVRHIDSAVNEWANCARDLREPHPRSTKECLTLWRTEVWEILRVFDVCVLHLAVPKVSKLSQEGLWRGGALEVRGVEQHVDGSAQSESLAPASVTVCCCFTASRPPLTDYLPNVDSVSVIYW